MINLQDINFEEIFKSFTEGVIFVNLEDEIELINEAARKILDKHKDTKNYNGKNLIEKIEKNKYINIITKSSVNSNEVKRCGTLIVFKHIENYQNDLLREIINSMQDAVVVIDENTKVILVNTAYMKLTGLTREDVIGEPATIDIAEGYSVQSKVVKNKKIYKNVKLKAGPAKKEVVLDAAPIEIDGKIRGSVGIIRDVFEIKKLTKKLNEAKKELDKLRIKYTYNDIIGECNEITKIIRKSKKIALTPITVLIRGESGTGKELFAHAIHSVSNYSKGKFVRVNCSALDNNILESELFGYVGGAFTGAKKEGKKGLLEEADGGTIFLDEIGEVGLDVQKKLLRFLQEKEIIRVGSTEPINLDVRVIVATNKDLEKAIQKGDFREDLYYRLNVAPLFIPPLRARKGDIELLMKNIIKKNNQKFGFIIKGYTDKFLNELLTYDWPGNIRELENVIARTMINTDKKEDILEIKHLPALKNESQKEFRNYETSQYNLGDLSLKELHNKIDKSIIIRILNENNGNRKKTAQKLGITTRALYYKLQKYNITK